MSDGLEAIYEFIAAETSIRLPRSFGAAETWPARPSLDGVILAGWRTGARVHVVYQRYPLTDAACVDAGAARRAHYRVS